VRRNPGNQYRFVLDGPALKVFKRKLNGVKSDRREDINRLIEESDLVLTGSGWASNLEKYAIKQSKSRRTKVATFLDHWCNYQDRFQHSGELVLPDEIWVGDAYALKIAEETFRNTPIRLIENPYLMDIRDEIKLLGKNRVDQANTLHILYICEPVSPHALIKNGREDAFGYTEFEAMDLFVSHLHRLVDSSRKVQVRIRPHPSEPSGKYDRFAGKVSDKLEITINHGNTLVDDCAWSDWVVGMNSMALVVALAAGKKVFCCIPGQSRSRSLPHDGIGNFLELNEI